MTNCPNCGAQIQGDICDHCGVFIQKYEEKINSYKTNIDKLKAELSDKKQDSYLSSDKGHWTASSSCIISDFDFYVERIIRAEEEDPLSEDPVCPFPGSNCECYVDRRDPKHGCKFCQDAKNAYEIVIKGEIKNGQN